MGTAGMLLSPNVHVEHAMWGSDDGEAFTAHVEAAAAGALGFTMSDNANGHF